MKKLMMQTALCVGLVSVMAMGSHPPGLHGSSERETRQDRVIEALEARLEAQPGNTVTLSKLAQTQLSKARRTGDHHDLEDAELSFRELSKLMPRSANAHLGIAYCQLGQHEFRDALDEARVVAQLEPRSVASWALLGDIHFALGNVAEAELFFDRCVDAEITLGSLARQAMMHEHRGRFDAAERGFREAILVGETVMADARDVSWCHLILGEMLMNLGRHDAARAEFARALELDTASVMARWRLGQLDLVTGNPERARESLEWLVHDEARPTFMVSLAQACAMLGDSPGERHWLDEAESVMVSDLEHSELGHVRELVELWIHRGTNLDRAAALAMDDLRLVRQDARTLETAAWAAHAAGDSVRAAALMDRCLLNSASSVRALVRAAAIHEALGDERRASRLRDAAMTRNASASSLAEVISP